MTGVDPAHPAMNPNAMREAALRTFINNSPRVKSHQGSPSPTVATDKPYIEDRNGVPEN
jgi:hypothetical protein